jgi:hypothetical protein
LALERTHAEGIAQVQQRCEAPCKQLLSEATYQREAFEKAQTQLASQLKFAERRIAAKPTSSSRSKIPPRCG